jgi:hypothetical protein
VKPKVLFLIIASNNPENERDLQAQLATWLAKIPPNYKFLIIRGSELSRFDYSSNTLYVPARELYENILLKTSLGIHWVIENMDFDLLIRTNVSTYFAIDQLDKIIDKIDIKEHFFGGYIERCRDPLTLSEISIPFVTGTALVMSKSVASILSKIPVENYIGMPDDVAISQYAKVCNLNVAPLKRNNLSQNHLFLPTYHIRLKTSKNSYLASRRMKDVHNYFIEKRKMVKLLKYFVVMGKEITYIEFKWRSVVDYTARLATSAKHKILSRRLWRDFN